MASKSLTFDLFGRDRSASKAIHGVSRAAGGLPKVFAAVGGAIAAAFAVTRIINFAKTVVSEFAVAQDSQNRLSDAFARFPILADANVEALRALNVELQRKTRFDDDALASGQAVLAQFNLTERQLTDLTPLLADYAAKTGVDINTAALQLGKALLGQGRALKAVGIDFVDAGSVAANYDQIIGGLRRQVGGFATKEGATFAGQIEILKNGVGELKERFGSLFAPALLTISTILYENVLPAVDSLIDRLGPGFQSTLERLAEFAGEFFTALAESAESGSMKPLEEFFSGLKDVAPIFAVLGTVAEVLGPLLPSIAEAFAELGETLSGEGVLDSLSQMVSDLLPPLVELLTAVSPLIPPIAQLLSTALVPALQLVAGNVGILTNFIDLLSGKLTLEEFLRAVQELPIVGEVFKFIGDTVLNVMNSIAGGVNGLVGAIEGAVNGVRSLMGLGSISLGRVPIVGVNLYGDSQSGGSVRKLAAFADGGLVRATPGGTIGRIGEAGTDEAVVPLRPDVLREIGAGIAEASSGGSGRTELHLHGVDPLTVYGLIKGRFGSGMAVLRG